MEKKTLFPAVSMYGPCNVRNLEEGEQKYWCACGLSRKQPWCDGTFSEEKDCSHKGTGIAPLKWIVPHKQTLYQLCACKYTKNPPYCDARHTNLPCEVLERQQQCTQAAECHTATNKLCTGCGWKSAIDF